MRTLPAADERFDSAAAGGDSVTMQASLADWLA